jgi:DNA-binding LytR/AlgR family response regulator
VCQLVELILAEAPPLVIVLAEPGAGADVIAVIRVRVFAVMVAVITGGRPYAGPASAAVALNIIAKASKTASLLFNA